MTSYNRNNIQKPLKKRKMQRKKVPEVQMDAPSLDSFPDEILSMIITKTYPLEVITLRTVSKKFFSLTSEQYTLKHVFAPKIIAMGMKTTPDGSHHFDARAVFKHVSKLVSNPDNTFWDMVRGVDEEQFLQLSSKKRFLVNLLKMGEEFFDSQNTKAGFMDPNTGEWCLAVAAYHPCFKIKGMENMGFDYGPRFESPHWMLEVESSRRGSRFDRKCAYFFYAYRPYISGRFISELPPGKYSFSWVWFFEDNEMDPETAMDLSKETLGKDEMIALTSKFTDGEVHYKWRLFTYEGSEWKLKWRKGYRTSRRTRNTYSKSARELVKSARKSITQPHNLKVQSDVFLEHEIGQFRVAQESDGSFDTSVLDFEMKDEKGTLGTVGGLYFDGFIIRRLD